MKCGTTTTSIARPARMGLSRVIAWARTNPKTRLSSAVSAEIRSVVISTERLTPVSASAYQCRVNDPSAFFRLRSSVLKIG
ncbi:hypothetical protein STSP_20040 [Streptomyces jeddahensis]|uniref:Uncharacterized protein n=1 Tax=Streptomyces jeddahensis TaxID=1716141 RepID=A0A177HWY4_9ACTN|nr:hypothetical protein STSP_20040 [Streptomyces jeddahensis]